MQRRVYVFDLDGTLSNLEHRLHYIKRGKPRWREFFEACDVDEPILWTIRLCNLIYKGSRPEGRVVIVTGRSAAVHDKTRAWLDRHCVNYDGLLMRPGGDFRPDELLKPELLDNWLKEQGLDRSAVEFIVDDRQKVVDRWRQLGFKVLQCDAWEEHAFIELHGE